MDEDKIAQILRVMADNQKEFLARMNEAVKTLNLNTQIIQEHEKTIELMATKIKALEADVRQFSIPCPN